MGRPRSFDESAAVVAAAAEFRDRGYASTSIDDLVAATGMHRGSLYGVFGSKNGLFGRVLDALDGAGDSRDLLDVIIVGLMEVAPHDAHTRERIAELIRAHEITADRLGSRMLSRAGLED